MTFVVMPMVMSTRIPFFRNLERWTSGFHNSSGFKSISKICTLIQNLNMYTITKTDEADPEKCEVVKVARFKR